MENEENPIINEIENDDFYRYYLQINNENENNLTKALTITEQVKKLGEGIDILNNELQKQVLEKHNDLLRQGNHATKLEHVLNTMGQHIQNLFANAEKLKDQITVPYNSLETHTKVLSRLHLASHILRQVSRIQQLSKRLANTNDPIQKATILQELEQLANDENLKDIEAVTTELRSIRAQRQKVVQLATGSLNQGIMNENTIQITTALQIFINLGTIQATLDNLLDISLNECGDCLRTAFNTSGVASNVSSTNKNKAPGKTQIGSSQGFRNRIWSEIEKAFSEEISQQCKQIRFLDEVLIKMKNENIPKDIGLIFWKKLGDLIHKEIVSSSSAVQQMFEEDYVKLLKCYYEMVEKLKYLHFTFDRQILEKCENSYLSTSSMRLLEPAQAMFNLDEIPTHDQIDSLIRVITNELSVTLIEEQLNIKVCKNITKCIKMVCVKTEQQIKTGPEAAQILAGNPNSGQQKNVQYANVLNYFQIQIQRILSNMKDNLSTIGVDIINNSLQNIENLIGNIIQPLIASINRTIETIIVTIHVENDWTKLTVPNNKTVTSCSPYMKEFNQFLMRAFNTYLMNFENKEVLYSKCSEIAVRSIELLVRHASILRPISQGGRIRLHADFLQLEQSLKLVCPHLVDLGRPYRLLRSMASLVLMSPEEIVASQADESSVPHSIILLLLFSFAGSELSSPHENTGWTSEKLSIWFDEHPSEIDRLDLIAGALQKYESIVRQKNSINYDPVYPIMSRFLENAVRITSK